jgi:hypothetical protein
MVALGEACVEDPGEALSLSGEHPLDELVIVTRWARGRAVAGQLKSTGDLCCRDGVEGPGSDLRWVIGKGFQDWAGLHLEKVHL